MRQLYTENFPVAVNINICWNNTIQNFLSLQKKNYKVVYQSKVTQFIGYERELTRKVHWF